MNNKLYVGNLPFSATDSALSEMFAQAGTVTSASIIIDRMSGRSKGFGFVEMSSEDEAQSAIEMFNDKEFEGRKMNVSIARPKEDRPRGDRGGYNRGGNDRGGHSNW